MRNSVKIVFYADFSFGISYNVSNGGGSDGATAKTKGDLIMLSSRFQVRRILDMVSLLQKSRTWRAKKLANLYDIHVSRIYSDFKIIAEFFPLKNKNGYYWIG